ncbi:MAG: RrF2 family transcriptional regulator [Stellaceae bacterium]
MRLTLHTDYALRVLMYVGAKEDGLATIPEIVTRFDISKGHIMKVVHQLGRQGYLETIRGKGGGMRLARKSAQIAVGAVVRDMEEELGVLGCLQGGEGYCRIEGCCVLRSALRDATNAFLATLDGYTLEDLLRPRRALARLLELDKTSPLSSAPRSSHRRLGPAPRTVSSRGEPARGR